MMRRDLCYFSLRIAFSYVVEMALVGLVSSVTVMSRWFRGRVCFASLVFRQLNFWKSSVDTVA